MTVSNAFLRSRKATVLTLPISILHASNKAVTIEWSVWNLNFGAYTKYHDPIN